MADPWENPPAWATGPDCFENAAQRRTAETDRWCAWDGTVQAYEVGSLHALAQALEEFRSAHRLVFREELTTLSWDLVRLIHFFDRQFYSPDFPLPPRLRNGWHTH